MLANSFDVINEIALYDINGGKIKFDLDDGLGGYVAVAGFVTGNPVIGGCGLIMCASDWLDKQDW